LVTIKNGLVPFFLVQFIKFWTPFALIFATCHYLKQGYFKPFQVQGNSYIVLDCITGAYIKLAWNECREKTSIM
jgi:hypothetical protein